VPLYCADAFTDRAFAGNPAGVCILDAPAEPVWMQRVACELNLSETAFLVPLGRQRWALRWFTPSTEVDLCGHATLAGAHILATEGFAPRDRPMVFETASGALTATVDDTGISLDFPAVPVEAAPLPAGLAEALGVSPRWSGRNRLDWLVEVASPAEVDAVSPDLRALARVDARGVIVSAAGPAPYDFTSRYFAPAVGVDEDPVTGSAHCALGPHWAPRLGRDELVGYQASARGGVVRVQVNGPRVVLGGRAVTVWRGELSREGGAP
jgi:PhzF family phenazine biosynthesis protein